MAKYSKKPTAEQRQNIILIVRVLRDLIGTPEAGRYRHTTVNRCTVGVAVRSKLFPLFNDNTRTTENGTIVANDGSGFHDVSDIAYQVFGKDYYDHIIFGGDTTGLMVYKQDDGEPQVRYLVDYIKSRYQITDAAIDKAMPATITRTVEVDTTKAKVQAVIDKNIKLIDACNVVLDKGNIASVVERRDNAIIENRVLRQFV